MTDERMRLAITMGDPAGIGPEITAKMLGHAEIFESCQPWIFGPVQVLKRAIAMFAADVPTGVAATDAAARSARWCWSNTPEVDSGNAPSPEVFDPGTAAAGWAAYRAIEGAAKAVLSGAVDGIVTGPINKEAIARCGFVGVGHTELLADLCGVKRDEVAMLLASPRLRVVHATTHVSLRHAIESLTTSRIVRVARLAAAAATLELGHEPRVAVCGLNPHAGEGGLFGDEETQVIEPAVDELRESGMLVVGPLPPDTVFVRAVQREFDVVIAMYHDQGHIPAKLVGFHDTVNVTLGLPVIRTSVDHGTAYDIAWKGVANAESLLSAVNMAIQIVRGRALTR